jgi:hypothetical protein
MTPDGAQHEMRKNDNVLEIADDESGIYYSVDGSQMKYDTATKTLFLPDGSRYQDFINVGGQDLTRYIDRNGNSLTFNHTTNQWSDTLGRTITLPPMNNQTPGDYTYTLPGVGGRSITYTLKWRNLVDVLTTQSALYYKGDFTLAYPHNPLSPSLFTSPDNQTFVAASPGQLFNPVVLSQIEFPNQTSYTFTYNVYGEIDKAVYPTGAYEKFTHSPVTEISGNLSYQTYGSLYSQGNRGVILRRVSPMGQSRR